MADDARLGALEQKDDRAAYAALRQLEDESLRSPALSALLPRFVAMLESERSYVRSRGLVLVAANAAWDAEGVIDGALGRLAARLADDKPVTARACVKALRDIARRKPALRGAIADALRAADPGIYRESMASLLRRDIAAALREIDESRS